MIFVFGWEKFNILYGFSLFFFFFFQILEIGLYGSTGKNVSCSAQILNFLILLRNHLGPIKPKKIKRSISKMIDNITSFSICIESTLPLMPTSLLFYDFPAIIHGTAPHVLILYNKWSALPREYTGRSCRY